MLLLLPGSLARAGEAVPSGYDVSASTAIHEGVEHLTLTAVRPEESVNVARVAPDAPVALKVVSAYDGIPHRTADKELPSDMCRRVACIAGINGDFHDLSSEQPLGGIVSGGRLLRSPRAGYDQVTLAADGTLHGGPLGWSGSLSAGDGADVPLSGLNVDRGPDGVVLYTSMWGDSTPGGADTELVVRAADPVGALGAAAVEIVGSRSRSGGIPADGAVLSGVGRGGQALRDFAASVANGTTPGPTQLQLHTAVDAVESLGANPVILRNGEQVFPDATNGFIRSRNPRTLFGWNGAGEVFLVTVDGRRDDADGMSLAQAADLLRGLGATDAVNFDGGGGTTFVVGGEVRNLPSDPRNPGPPAYPDGHVIAPGHVERLAPNALVIVPKPPDPPAGPAPAPPDTTTTTGGTSPSGAEPGSGTTGTTGPAAGGNVVLTTGGGLLPVGSGEGLPPATDPSGFLTAGEGGRWLVAAPDKHTGKGNKAESNAGDGAIGDLSGDWLSAVAPSFPGLVSGPGPTALAFGGYEEEGSPPRLALTLAGMVASGLILLVLWGISRVRNDRRRPVLWL